MERLTWPEMKQYWEAHSRRWCVDLASDRDALANVLQQGEPAWLNAFFARLQRRVFTELLKLVPPPRPGEQALDVGCGAGRWARLLAGRGYRALGIDLQRPLIEGAQTLCPEIEFRCVAVQDFNPRETIDLLASVTVVQHIPFEEQDSVIRKMRSLLRAGGHALLLENIRNQAPHVFANTIRGWIARFERAGFLCRAVRPYEYTPFVRLHAGAEDRLSGRSAGPEGGYAAPRLHRVLRRCMLCLDMMVEPFLDHGTSGIPPVHSGFLFRAA